MPPATNPSRDEIFDAEFRDLLGDNLLPGDYTLVVCRKQSFWQNLFSPKRPLLLKVYVPPPQAYSKDREKAYIFSPLDRHEKKFSEFLKAQGFTADDAIRAARKLLEEREILDLVSASDLDKLRYEKARWSGAR